jgi:hypothetical protein
LSFEVHWAGEAPGARELKRRAVLAGEDAEAVDRQRARRERRAAGRAAFQGHVAALRAIVGSADVDRALESS